MSPRNALLRHACRLGDRQLQQGRGQVGQSIACRAGHTLGRGMANECNRVKSSMITGMYNERERKGGHAKSFPAGER